MNKSKFSELCASEVILLCGKGYPGKTELKYDAVDRLALGKVSRSRLKGDLKITDRRINLIKLAVLQLRDEGAIKLGEEMAGGYRGVFLTAKGRGLAGIKTKSNKIKSVIAPVFKSKLGITFMSIFTIVALAVVLGFVNI